MEILLSSLGYILPILVAIGAAYLAYRLGVLYTESNNKLKQAQLLVDHSKKVADFNKGLLDEITRLHSKKDAILTSDIDRLADLFVVLPDGDNGGKDKDTSPT